MIHCTCVSQLDSLLIEIDGEFDVGLVVSYTPLAHMP